MDAKIPPDIILLGGGALMWLVAKYAPGFGFQLGYHAVLSAMVFLSGLIIIFLAKATFTCYQIIPEEKMLERIFGDELRRYKNWVRRWI